jgi:pimeloyl-ACP methyl ester carboxylesterase
MKRAAISAQAVNSQDGTPVAYRTLGAGDGLLVIGGAWRSGRDYLPLAEALSESFTVHVIDRRGRAMSGPQGPAYSIGREVEDVLAVQKRTSARSVFGHSYGGLIALEAARASPVFSDVFVYEPAVSIAGSIPLGWIEPYRERLQSGDSRGAFAEMVKGAGGAPPVVERMPLWYLKLVLRLFIRGERWRDIEALLEPAVAEHKQVQALDQANLQRYQALRCRVHLFGGSKSPRHHTTQLFEAMQAVLPNCTTELIAGLDHLAPDDKAPRTVAQHVLLRACNHREPARLGGRKLAESPPG